MSLLARKLTLGSALRVVNLAATVLVSFFMMPFVVHTLGDKLYGIWTLVATFVSYYGLMDLGLSAAVTRHLSRALGAEDLEECNEVFNTALLIYLCIGGAVLIVGGVLATMGSAFTKDPHDAQLLSRLLLITSFTAALGFPVRVFVGVLNSHLRYDRTATMELMTLFFRNGLMVVVLLAGDGILGLAWATLLGSLPAVGFYVYFSFRDLPFLRLDPKYRRRKAARSLFTYSSFSFIAQLADILRFQVDALVVAAFVGVAAVTHYRIAGTMMQYFIELMLAGTGIFNTVFSRQEGSKDFAALQRTFLFASKISVTVSSFVGFGLLAWGRVFIMRWMGPQYLDAYPCLMVLICGGLTAQWQSPSVGLLYGTSRHRFFALFNSVEAVANLLLSILLAKRLGIVGVALGTAIPMAIVKLLIQPVYVCRVAGVSYLRYMRQMGTTLLAVAVALILPYLLTARLIAPDYKILIAIGLVSTLLYAPVAWLLVFNAEERRMLQKRIWPKFTWRSKPPEECVAPAQKMLLMGYYGVRNLGDDMMLLCLRKWLARQNVEITVLSEFPDEIHRSFGFPAVQNVPLLGEWSWMDTWLRGHAFRLIRAFLGHDGLIVGGGDLIRDDRGWKSFLVIMEKIILTILLRKPVYLVNVGIGRPHTAMGRRILAWTLPRCRKIIVRDHRSLDLCREFRTLVEYMPDIVLSLEHFLEEHISPLAGRPYAVICLRSNPNVFQQFEFGEKQVRTMAGILDYMVDRHGLDIVFLPFQSAAGNDDNQIHARIAAEMRQGDRARVRPWSGDLVDVARCLSGSRCVVAMRLHAAVLAAAFHRPCILLPYDHKVVEFGKQLNGSHVAISNALEDLPAILSVIDRAMSQKTALRDSLEGRPWDNMTLSRPPLS